MNNVKDLHLLGLRVRDRVTGYEGVVSSVGYDLYGCIQAVVTPAMKEPGKLEDSRWFDTKRLEVLDKKPVMEVPCFDVKSGAASTVHDAPGPQEKSIPRNL